MRKKIFKPEDCGIYVITNMVNGKKLIGQSIEIKKRWRHGYISVLRKNKFNNPYFQNAWNKDGEQNFKHETILLCAPQDLDDAEIFFIQAFKTYDRRYGYNIELGGNAKKIITLETREKMSRAKMGHKLSEENRQKLIQSHTGERHFCFGKHRTDEVKKKISETVSKIQMGHILSDETKKKISIALIGKNVGKHRSKDTREKMSKAKTGIKQSKETIRKRVESFRGYKHSEESKRKIRESWIIRKQKIEQQKENTSE